MATQTTDNAPRVSVPSRKGRRPSRATVVETPALADLPLFAGVDEATLARLSFDAKVENFENGAVIFRQGDPVGAIVVILHGYVKELRIASNGDETLIGVRADGETLGEPVSGGNDVYGVSAEAVGATSVMKLPAQRFARLMKESPSLCSAVAADARNKIATLVSEIETLKAQNADQRLAHFLLSLCPPGEERCRFRLPYDKRLIAAQLGVKQETLSRAFAKLRDYGVRTETRDILVESVSRLVDQFDNLGRQTRLPSERAARDDAA